MGWLCREDGAFAEIDAQITSTEKTQKKMFFFSMVLLQDHDRMAEVKGLFGDAGRPGEIVNIMTVHPLHFQVRPHVIVSLLCSPWQRVDGKNQAPQEKNIHMNKHDRIQARQPIHHDCTILMPHNSTAGTQGLRRARQYHFR